MRLKKVLSYIKENKFYFIAVLILFAISIIIGIFWQPEFLASYVKDIINQLSSQLEGKNFFQLLSYIFFNNLFVSFLGMILGLAFGIFPLIAIFLNGYVIGFVSERVFGEVGISVVTRLLPHGIFELPAVVLALGLGLKLGVSLIFDFSKVYSKKNYFLIFILLALIPFVLFLVIFVLSLQNKKLRINLANNLRNSLSVFLYIILPLLIIAGVIETALIFLV